MAEASPTAVLITGARVFDGTGAPLVRRDVLINGDRITRVAGSIPAGEHGDARIVDGTGTVLMPGLIDGHAHLGFGSSIEHLASRREPREEQVLLIAHTGRVMLDCGFTSAYSGGNRLPRAEVAARKAFAEGWLPGPRLRAASWEGSAGPDGMGGFDFPGTEGRRSDPDAVARFVDEMADLGVDTIKINLSGESAVAHGTSRVIQFTDEEVAVATGTARARGLTVSAHAHAAGAITMAVRHGVRAVYHCSFADDEAIDALAGAKDRTFVAPTPGIIDAHLNDPKAPPMEDGMETVATRDSVKAVVPELVKRGVRLVIGGDYGFSFNPTGRNAHDLTLFVEWFGLTATQALEAATRNGGELMGLGHELGLVREGYLADLLLVDGDPTEDVSIMEHPANLSMVMKAGRLHRLDHRRAA
jgi:imidazolonepropionase-like amidohydrolase